ncbi:NUDIX domain-containing protein [Nocardia lijiangensis]|uniref:NUDIX domain-containing protein n=1 Tax=Nocardia lijiangensis TaxID=299618 RepID=UPI003D70B39C
MQRRTDDGQRGLPGGAIELGESAASAVVREVAEETGLRVEIEALQGSTGLLVQHLDQLPRHRRRVGGRVLHRRLLDA